MVSVFVSGSSIDIGRQLENDAREIYFDLSGLEDTYGQGTATLVHMRQPDSAPYVCDTRVYGQYLIWTVNNTDTAYAGTGKCELRWVVGETLAKSITYITFVAPSITAGEVVPDPYQAWYESLLEQITEYVIASNQIAVNTSDIATLDGRVDANASNIASLDSQADANTSAISVLDGRMDEFTRLPDGSTAGDAELIDIRVGADGTTYASAGTAVREQVRDLKADLNVLYSDVSVSWVKGIPTSTGTNGGGNGVMSNIVTNAQRVSLSSNCRAVLLIYSGTECLGKLNASGGIDSQGGNWRYFTGDISVGRLVGQFGGDGFVISAIPTDSTTVTSDTAQTYGDNNCSAFSAYSKDELDEKFAKKQDAVSKNLIGMTDGKLYSVDGLEVGTTLTMSTSDGAAVGLGTDGSEQYVMLGFYDDNKQMITYWSFNNTFTQRTITLGASSGAGAKYLSWLHSPRTALQLEFGDTKTEYAPYFESVVTLTKEIEQLTQNTNIVDLHKLDKNEVYALNKHYAVDGAVSNSFKALWVSDIHNESDRTVRMVDLLNDWGSSYFDIAINTGDTVLSLYSQDISWYNDAVSNSTVPILNTVGNHDSWATLSGTLEDKVNVYNKFIAPVAEQASIVQPSDASSNGYNYYYKDVGGIRVIVLDCMYWDATELAWFESVLADARTNSLPVIACSHAPFAQTYCSLLESIWNVGWFHRDGTTTDIAAAQAVKDFMDAGGIFVCWLQGHIHGDEIETLPNYGNQIALCINSFQNRGTTVVKNDDKGAYNYDCLTYITVDTITSSIKMYRIGANIDTAGHKRNGFVWNYSAGQLVTEW